MLLQLNPVDVPGHDELIAGEYLLTSFPFA